MAEEKEKEKSLDIQAPKNPRYLPSIRFFLSLVAFLALALQYSQKINMSVAIVCMINNTYQMSQTAHTPETTIVSNSKTCGALDSAAKSHFDGPFKWSKSIQGTILGTYFIGYTISEIPGGYLSMKFGPKIVLAVSYFLASVLTILLPLFARWHYIALLVCRFFIGLFHGVVWPAFAGFWAAWAPPSERSRLIGVANAGSQIGNVITLPLGGFLCIYGFDGGWPSIFYIIGAAGLVWLVLWWIISSDKPDNHRFIGKVEKEYIIEKTAESRASAAHGEANAPWCAIMSSKPCLALFFGHAASNWGTYLFLTSLPTYMKEVLHFDVKSNGGLSAVPYLAFWFSTILSGIIGDVIMGTGKLSKSNVRKIFHILCFFFPMFPIIGLIFVTCEVKMMGVLCLALGLFFTGCGFGAGFLVNYNDISGSFSSITFGIGNTFGSIPGIIAPYVVGVLTKNKTQEEWRIVFIITAVIYFLGGVVMLIFSEATLQPWAAKKKEVEVEEEKGEKVDVKVVEVAGKQEAQTSQESQQKEEKKKDEKDDDANQPEIQVVVEDKPVEQKPEEQRF